MDKELSLQYLYTALADELLASYQYWVAKNCSRGAGKFDVDPEFSAHADEEMDHANEIMERIKQLGGSPIPRPEDWIKLSNPWTPIDTRDIHAQLEITIQAEQAAIDFYTKAISAVKDTDPVTHKLFRKLLKDECEHIYDLKELFCEVEDCDFSDIEQGLGITASISIDEFKKQISSMLEEASMNNLSAVSTIDSAIQAYENIQSLIEGYKNDNMIEYNAQIEWFSGIEEEIENSINSLNEAKAKIGD